MDEQDMRDTCKTQRARRSAERGRKALSAFSLSPRLSNLPSNELGISGGEDVRKDPRLPNHPAQIFVICLNREKIEGPSQRWSFILSITSNPILPRIPCGGAHWHFRVFGRRKCCLRFRCSTQRWSGFCLWSFRSGQTDHIPYNRPR